MAAESCPFQPRGGVAGEQGTGAQAWGTGGLAEAQVFGLGGLTHCTHTKRESGLRALLREQKGSWASVFAIFDCQIPSHVSLWPPWTQPAMLRGLPRSTGHMEKYPQTQAFPPWTLITSFQPERLKASQLFFTRTLHSWSLQAKTEGQALLANHLTSAENVASLSLSQPKYKAFMVIWEGNRKKKDMVICSNGRINWKHVEPVELLVLVLIITGI